MTIVVGYISSDEGEAAFEAAISHAKLTGEKLLVLNTTRGDRLVDQNFAQEDELAEVASRLTAEGLDHEILQPLRGHDPADEILELAGRRNASLIVIGLRKRSPVGKLLMGSTAQRILLQAESPVLAVKA
ncbi:universal stress protein [Neomicrococcus aestuarii]|uniref:Nucleotide-binding universal stress UspA family protein n=1 Tax=Neomicrococcus aestuarii TaxID=556325 RepID=A0A1L2ZMP1_9MICC|nr:universal stress protein [Neomicrococcus aestuarii]APF40386.1 universal stress protein UspA [Neomicrococcus aestuarii]MBB5511545.1 nucleotide-binding universal stress UspA family protein [Neomicrococcus aestuarii]